MHFCITVPVGEERGHVNAGGRLLKEEQASAGLQQAGAAPCRGSVRKQAEEGPSRALGGGRRAREADSGPAVATLSIKASASRRAASSLPWCRP